MQYVPVLSSTGARLMPCHAARARALVRRGRALRRFDRGLFYIQLLDRKTGSVQPIAVGIDPGSKKEAITVKSESHTYLNLQADAVTWVKEAEAQSTLMLRTLRAGGRVALADFVLVPNDNGTFVVESHEVSKEVVL